MNNEYYIRNYIRSIGDNPFRDGLKDTPKRFKEACDFWFSGYKGNPKEVLKTFECRNYTDMITIRNIPFYSHCEHHLAPFFGKVTIGYMPDHCTISGLSKFSRLVQIYSRRLQTQEKLTTDIANALLLYLDPKGVGVFINARHLCMESRGICQAGQITTTQALRRSFYTVDNIRNEFLEIARTTENP